MLKIADETDHIATTRYVLLKKLLGKYYKSDAVDLKDTLVNCIDLCLRNDDAWVKDRVMITNIKHIQKFMDSAECCYGLAISRPE